MTAYVMFRRRTVPFVRARLAARKVGGVMGGLVLRITGEHSLGDALAAMVGAGVRHLVVVDREGRCRGVLSDRDIASAFARDPSALTWQRVRDVVGPPMLVHPASTVGDAARAMCTGGVDAVAVVEADARPIGIVTAGDLVTLLAARY